MSERATAEPASRAPWLVAAVCIPLVLGTVWRAHQLAYDPAGLPTWDSAGYLLEGVKIHEYLVWGDIVGLIGQLLRPDLHPPLHALVLGSWLAAFGNTLAAARAYPVFAYLLGGAAIVAIGRRVSGEWTAGLLAALAFSVGLASLDLLCTPMTESTALWTELLALGCAIHLDGRRDIRSRLWVGLAVFAAGMVRYNLWPMLLAPLYVHHAWTHRRGIIDAQQRKALFDPSVLLWMMPTALGLAVWQVLRPDLATNIQKFLENRSSGIPFWSAENLAWVPIQTTAEFVGTWWVTVPVFALFGVGVLRSTLTRRRTPADQGLDLLRLFVLASAAALTLHDFKVVRNLHTVLPLLYLCAFHELSRLKFKRLPLAVVVLPLCVGWTTWQHTTTLQALPARSDFKADPIVRQTLEFIEARSRESKRVWVTGWVFRISPNVIDWWLRTHEVPAKLKLDQPLFGEQTRVGVDSSWNEKYPEWVASTLLTPELLPQTTYITLQTAPGTRYADDWKAFGNNYARAFAEQAAAGGQAPEIDRLSFIDQGLTVRAYRAGGQPSAATLASREHPPDAADNADVRLPPGTPWQRDTLHGLASAWHVYPPKALEHVTVTRAASALALHMTEPVADLQLCSDVQTRPEDPAAPGTPTFRGVVNLSTTGFSGKAWLHFRGMDRDQKLVQRNLSAGAPSGSTPDITQAGPIAPDGPQLFERDITLDPGSTHFRTCIVLGGATGTVVLNDVAFYAANTPWIRAATVAAASAQQAGGVAAIYPEDDAGIELPAGDILFREAFNRDQTGWRLVPAGAPDVVTRRDGSDLVIDIAQAQPTLQLCGPTIPLAKVAGAGAPTDAVAHLSAEALTGRGVFFHWRGLDKDGVLVRDGDTPAIQMSGPMQGSSALRSAVQLRYAPEVTQVRPCVVLDGVAGRVRLKDLSVVAVLAP